MLLTLVKAYSVSTHAREKLTCLMIWVTYAS